MFGAVVERPGKDCVCPLQNMQPSCAITWHLHELTTSVPNDNLVRPSGMQCASLSHALCAEEDSWLVVASDGLFAEVRPHLSTRARTQLLAGYRWLASWEDTCKSGRLLPVIILLFSFSFSKANAHFSCFLGLGHQRLGMLIFSL
jgi:hypothetical protein